MAAGPLGDLEDILESVKTSAVDLSSPLQDIEGLLESLAAAQQDLSAAQEIAAATGSTVAQVQKAIADQTRAAAEAAKAAAAAQRESMKAEEKAAKDAAAAQEKAAKDAADAKSAALAQSKSDFQAALHPINAVNDALSEMGPEGAAVAAALTVATAAVTATVGALVAMSAAAISVVQQRAGLLATFSALAGGGAAGGATLAMVEKLGQTLPFATEQIGQWTQGLMAAGFAGKDLEGAVKAVAAAAALMPEGGAAAAQNLLSKLKEGGKGAETLVKSLKEGGGKSNKMLAEMGLNTKDLAAALGLTVDQLKTANLSAEQMQKAIEKALQKKGAGPLEELGTTFPVLIQKVKEGFMSLFTDLGPSVKPFMKSVKSLFGEFSKGGGVIKALKPIVTAVMSTLFSWGTSAVKVIHDIVTWFLNSGKAGGVFSGALVVLKAGWKALVVIFTSLKAALSPIISYLAKIFSNAMVLRGLKTLFTIIAGAIVAVVVVFATLAAAVATVVGFVVAAVGTLVASFMGLVGEVTSIFSSLADVALGAGGNFISGLVNGITSGAGAVLGAVTSLAGSIKSGLLGALGIASPSKFAQGAASNVTDSFSDTIEDGAPDAGKAMTKLAQPPKLSKTGSGGKKSGGDGKLAEQIHFHYEGPADQADDFFDKAAAWLEKLRREGPSAEPQP